MTGYQQSKCSSTLICCHDCKRGSLSYGDSVCPSVPSVTHLKCVKTTERIIELFRIPISHVKMSLRISGKFTYYDDDDDDSGR